MTRSRRIVAVCELAILAQACAGQGPSPRMQALSVGRRAFVATELRDVEVHLGQYGVPGSLIVPVQGDCDNAAVLIAGSGPLDRDGTIGNRKPLRDLAMLLAASGIATVRFDKRAFAMPSEIDPHRVTVDDEIIDDATAAVSVLRSHAATREARIFLIGHSLGALLAPEIAERAGKIAGIVLLAPPGRPLPLLIVEQLRAARAIGVDEAEAESRRILSGAAPADEMFFGAPASYYRDLEKRAELPRAARLGIPVLVLRGSNDLQIRDEDFDAWIKAFAEKAQFSGRRLDGLDHLFYTPDGHFGATAADAITEFIWGHHSSVSALSTGPVLRLPDTAERNASGSAGDR